MLKTRQRMVNVAIILVCTFASGGLYGGYRVNAYMERNLQNNAAITEAIKQGNPPQEYVQCAIVDALAKAKAEYFIAKQEGRSANIASFYGFRIKDVESGKITPTQFFEAYEKFLKTSFEK